MTWCVDADGAEAHVHPAYEEHVIGRDCWCGPRRLEDVEVYPIYLHRDLLERKGPEDPEPLVVATCTCHDTDSGRCLRHARSLP